MTYQEPQAEPTTTTAQGITIHDRTYNDGGLFALMVLLDSIQDFADSQGLLYDDDNRDKIDAAVRRLLVLLDAWGDLAPHIPARCLDWRARCES